MERKAINELKLYLNPRYIFGLILIIASFASAYLISRTSDRMIEVWAASVDLGRGEQIETGDLKVIKVRLPENADQYLDARTDLVGTTVLRPIGSAELIPSFAISSDANLSLVRVPVSIAREWAPIELSSGTTIDVYGIANRANQFSQEPNSVSKLILSGVTVDSVDESSRDLGGRVGMTLLVPETRVELLVSSISSFEFLLVSKPTSR